jgi:uncharacterized membrane protein YciS (DUF1049 family)
MAIPGSMPAAAPSRLHSIVQLLRAELTGLARTCFRAFLRTTLIVAVPIFFLAVRQYFSEGEGGGAGEVAIALAVYAAMSLFYAAHAGLVAAVLAGAWRLFGMWMFFPVVASIAILLGLVWLFDGVLSQQFMDIVSAARDVAHANASTTGAGALVSDPGLGRFAVHAGGGAVGLLLLVLYLPLLLIAVLSIATNPEVLIQFAQFLALVGVLFVLATFLSVVVCAPPLLWSLVSRARARQQLRESEAASKGAGTPAVHIPPAQ